MTTKGHRNSLKPGYKLHWYRIIQILGQGGFGITYQARDLNLDREVAIKEYLPVEMAVREGDYSVHPLSEAHGQQYSWGLDRFIVEARTLAKFDHPNIVRVYSVFEENNTGYMVMRYERGQSLQEKIDLENTLSEAEVLQLIKPVLSGLEIIHRAGFIHRDIKPDNIYLREDGSPVLIDFGSARQALGERTKTLTSLITPGYAPIEQYYSKSDEQGAWTDIYSLGATVYRAITGVAPKDALERSRTMLELQRDTFIYSSEICGGRFSDVFLKAIDHALQFRLRDRPQTITDWRHEFGFHTDVLEQTRRDEAERLVTRLDNAAPARREPDKPGSQAAAAKPGPLRPVLLVLLLVLLAGAGGYYFRQGIVEGVLNLFMGTRHDETVPTADSGKVPDEIRPPAAAAGSAPIPAGADQRSSLLQSARQHLASGQITTPPGANAVQDFREVLKLDPDNQTARDGLEEIYQLQMQSATSLTAQGKFDEAESALSTAESIHAGTVAVRLARQQLDEARNAYEQARLEQQQRQQESRALELEKQKQAQEQLRFEQDKARLQAANKREQQAPAVAEQAQAAIKQEQPPAKKPAQKNQVASFLDRIIFPDVDTMHRGMVNICNYYSEDDPGACRRSIDQCRGFAQDSQELYKYCVSEYVGKLISLSNARQEAGHQ